ncbi:MAG TPA: UvrD-helicase domain-containing protein, partial [Euzebya sp.]|nr:UvrD-helicase domain-containing protein [Euzebya sp.]
HPAKGLHLAAVGRAAAEQVEEEKKRRRGTMTFDDLLVRLERSLRDDAAAEAITGAMRRAFSLALIDEFQDTDPIQWAILRRLFGDGRLVLIGDPKQAIYSFRGADVHAYLEATGSDAEAATLGVNWRSDRRLLDVLNTLFDGTRFGHDRIAHRAVDAHHQQDRLIFPDGPRPPFQVRAIAETGLKVGPARDRIAADVVTQVAGLLAADATITDEDGTRRPLAPGDCAILVRTNDHATRMKDALVGSGIPAVVNGVGSVLRTPAKDDWDLLLHALEQPSSQARVRALSLTWLVGHTAAELDAMDDVADAALHEQTHRWSRLLAEKGVASLVRAVARDTRLYERVLSLVGGDRWLTDVEHIAELLHTASSGESISPGGLRTWMVAQADGSDDLPSEQLARRLESDARAVQILTIHRAKGLEFGVVLCPDLVAAPWQVTVPVHVRDPQTGAAYIDAGSADEGAAKESKKVADAGEQLRTLYVALTRARHRLIVWWWPFEWSSAMQLSPLSKVLFCDGDGDGDVRVSAEQPAPLTKGDGEGVLAALRQAGDRLGPDAEVVLLPPEEDDAAAMGAVAPGTDFPGMADAALDRRRFRGDVDWLWTRASFSALTSPRPHARVPVTPDTVPVVSDEAAAEREDDLHLPSASDLAGHLPLPLHAQPAGAAFGTMVHAVLEHAELDADDLGLELATAVTAQMAATGTTVPDPDALAAGVLAACRTPMGPAFDDATLAGVTRRDRLDELEFELPVTHHGAHVTLEALAALLADHLGPDDPLAGYPAMLADRSLRQGFRGYLAGFVDLIWRRQTPDGPVFHVIDHKSNRLYSWEEALAEHGGSTWHYRAEAMTRSMQHSHYVLQGLVYRVALHRYLRWRLPGYDPARHLGAIGYTFLRGMAGP